MKRVTIPTVMSPWECIIDGVKYTYPAGKTMDVPDQVAELIAFYNQSQKEEIPESETKKLEDKIRSIAQYEARQEVYDKTAIKDLPIFILGNSRNSFFRGKCIGGPYTAEQKRAIKYGSFEGMYVGDYWATKDYAFVIAGFDCLQNSTSSLLDNKHSLTMFAVPYNKNKTFYMNGGESVENVSFLDTKLNTEVLPAILKDIEAFFGSSGIVTMLCEFRDSTANNNVKLYGVNLTLPTQQQVFGTDILQQTPSINGVPQVFFVEGQLPFFRYISTLDYLDNSGPYGDRNLWLRDKPSIDTFLAYSIQIKNLHAYNYQAKQNVMPIFCINGD